MATRTISTILFLSVIIIGASGGNVIFEDCGSAYDLDEVKISGCERTVPCYIAVGVPINVTVIYKAGFVSNSLRQNSYVILNSVLRENNIFPSACEATWCPVKIDIYSTYDVKMELPKNLLLNTRGHLYWEIYNEKSMKLICFRVTIQTKSAFKQLQESEILNRH